MSRHRGLVLGGQCSGVAKITTTTLNANVFAQFIQSIAHFVRYFESVALDWGIKRERACQSYPIWKKLLSLESSTKQAQNLTCENLDSTSITQNLKQQARDSRISKKAVLCDKNAKHISDLAQIFLAKSLTKSSYPKPKSSGLNASF